MQELERSLANALSERDFVKRDVVPLRQSEKTHLGEEAALADELRNSAQRVEELASQVRQQLASNSTLRQRLAETIERGEKEQNANASKITSMQSRLKALEDKLMTAQQTSEETIAQHEEKVRALIENHNTQLQRVQDSKRTPRPFDAKSPTTPILASSTRAPRIGATTSGKARSVAEDLQMEELKRRVAELESALADADLQMEEVVGRMNTAQIEVMNLQNEREEAVRQTRRLQKMVEEERMTAFQGRFATLAS